MAETAECVEVSRIGSGRWTSVKRSETGTAVITWESTDHGNTCVRFSV